MNFLTSILLIKYLCLGIILNVSIKTFANYFSDLEHKTRVFDFGTYVCRDVPLEITMILGQKLRKH